MAHQIIPKKKLPGTSQCFYLAGLAVHVESDGNALRDFAGTAIY